MRIINVHPLLALSVLLGLLASPPVVALDEQRPPERGCDFSATREVNLTGAKEPQTLTIAVKGATCSTAEYRITVATRAGRTLFRASRPWCEMAVFEHCDLKTSERVAASLVDELGDMGVTGMPERGTAASAEEEMFDGEWLVGERRYARLRAQGLPMLCHSTSRGLSCVVFDRRARKFVEVLGPYE